MKIVRLGAYHSDRTAFSARLISIGYQGKWYCSLTNVLDPHMLTGAEVARLYGRRWDIELAFQEGLSYPGRGFPIYTRLRNREVQEGW